MIERTTRPCCFPGCRAADGNPEMTRDGICPRSRAHYRRLLFEWLPEDFHTLRATLPSPVSTGPKTRTSTTKTYGHPAEWASDQVRAIATTLNQIHDAIAELRGDAPAPAWHVAETVRVDRALRYLDLDDKFDTLCMYVKAGEAAAALNDLHRGIRSAMGHGSRIQRLPVPCPECDLKLLVRVLDDMDPHVECRNSECGVRIRPEQYGLWTRIVLDDELSRTVIK